MMKFVPSPTIINIGRIRDTRERFTFLSEELWTDRNFRETVCNGCGERVLAVGGEDECPCAFDFDDPRCVRHGLVALIDNAFERLYADILSALAAWGCLARDWGE